MVGAGRVAQVYMQAFAHCREAELVAVADSCIEAAQAMGEKMRCPSYPDFRAMTKSCHLDAAIVCTPPASHPEVSIGLLNAGVHVLCEKPFSINARQALRMADVARKNRLKLTMASKFRFVTDVIAAKSMVASGMLGDLILCENSFASRVDMCKRWNCVPEISGGGVLIDNGTHSIDLMRYFLGPLSEIYVLEGTRTQGLPVEETVVALVHNSAGVIGSINLSWSIDHPRSSFLNIYGSRGSISIGWKESKYRDYSVGKWAVFGSGYDKLQAFRAQIENFSRAIRGVEPLLLTAEEAVSSVVIMEAAYLALRRSQWIEIAVAEPIKHGNGLGTWAST